MRTIKFRGKRLDNGEWVYGDLEIRRIDNRCFIHTYNDDGIYFRQFEVIKETVGQFTGLCECLCAEVYGFTDKLGKEIYEADILASNGLTNRDVVVWHEDYSQFCLMDYETWRKYNTLKYPENKHPHLPCLGFVISQDYRIVGNIHDNPELIRKGRKI